jgi:ATP-citrate lyase beta-subunit
MAQKAIREYHAKRMISKLIPELNWNYKGILVSEENLDEIDKLNFEKYVAKPDQLFGKRGKNRLIFISQDKKELKKWIKSKIGKKANVIKNEQDKGIEGVLTHFLVEPAVEHESEYYIAIKSNKGTDSIYFSNEGGIDIEENWDSVTEIEIPFELNSSEVSIDKTKLKDIDPQIVNFINKLYIFYKTYAFTYLELNPFVVDEGNIIPLDTVARVDSTAQYDMDEYWEEIEFPKPFGSDSSVVENEIEKLDAKTGASLKLTILNPDGRIWLLTAGGGASVIYADTVADLGYVDELANYGEYSGNPSQDETEAYCDNLFKAMFASKAKNKVLIIGGGIANFTDVAATFKGIINSIKNNYKEFLKQNIKIFVRRGGPNYRQGLDLINKEVSALGIPIEVHGPELHMTRVVTFALK